VWRYRRFGLKPFLEEKSDPYSELTRLLDVLDRQVAESGGTKPSERALEPDEVW